MLKVTLSQSCIMFLFIFSLAVPSVVCSAGIDCTISPGCTSDVQTSSGGSCTSISNCKDRINRSSSVNNMACYIDNACSDANPGQYYARDASSGSCVPLMYCDELMACMNAALGGTCGGGSNDCTISPGCTSDVQTSSGGSCTSISNCKDRINRSSSVNNMACYIDNACSDANPGQYYARAAGSGSCVPLMYCDELMANRNAAYQADLDASYQTGKQACISNPASCGINAAGVSQCGSIFYDGLIPFIHYPCVNIGGTYYWADLGLYSTNPTILLDVRGVGVAQ